MRKRARGETGCSSFEYSIRLCLNLHSGMAECPGTKRAEWLKQETLIRTLSTLPSLQNENVFSSKLETHRQVMKERKQFQGRVQMPTRHYMEVRGGLLGFITSHGMLQWRWHQHGQPGDTGNPLLSCLPNKQEAGSHAFYWEEGGLDLRINLLRIHKRESLRDHVVTTDVRSQMGKRW